MRKLRSTQERGDRAVASAGARARTEAELRALVLKYRPRLFFRGSFEVEFHTNVSTMASLSGVNSCQRFRIHEVFANAPRHVLVALVRNFFCHGGARARRDRDRATIFDFLERHDVVAASRAASYAPRHPLGRVYDLRAVQSAIRARFLPQCPALQIGWSDRVSPCLMGKWIAMPHGQPNLVVVNPLLDSPHVPNFYLQYVVFHELLHEVIPIRRERGRWIHHPVEFRRREREFPLFDRALAWECGNIGHLWRAHERASGEGPMRLRSRAAPSSRRNRARVASCRTRS